MFTASDLNAVIQIRGSIDKAIDVIEEIGVEINNDFLRGFMLADILRSANEISHFFQIYFQKEAREVGFPTFPNITATGEDVDFQVAIDYLKDFQVAIDKISLEVAEIEIDPVSDQDLFDELKSFTNPEN